MFSKWCSQCLQLNQNQGSLSLICQTNNQCPLETDSQLLQYELYENKYQICHFTMKLSSFDHPMLCIATPACGFLYVHILLFQNLSCSAPVRLYYIFSVKGLVDFVSTLPIILYWRYHCYQIAHSLPLHSL